VRLSLHRKKAEPPGIWHGEPRLYSRWRYGNRVYRLTTVSIGYGEQGMIVLEYHPETALLERMRPEPVMRETDEP
jgi:hypothetical protein